MDNRYRIAQIIQCHPDEPRYIGDQDMFDLQRKVIDGILREDRDTTASAVIAGKPDPVQLALAEDIKDAMRRGQVDRERAKQAIRFLSDGLSESFRDGTGHNQFGDTAYDTISSGWKNALVNGQAYKSFLGLARMMGDLGEESLATDYRQRAVRLRVAYNRQFYDAQKGRYIWWIGKDGLRHDYANPLIQANAVLFGIADRLEQDTGIKRDSKDVMQTLWQALDQAEYVDSAKGRTVDYIDSTTGTYTGFYWGIPNNLEDVPDAYNFQRYGSYEFPFYCNGGIFPQDTVAIIMAFSHARMSDKAAIIQRQIFKRQHEGILPNGSGFYMGIVNGTRPCYSIMKWDGTPTDYEGIISRDCAFLQTALLAEDPAQKLFEDALSEEHP